MDGNSIYDLHFVLVETETAANIGGVCRAMKNMGFLNLHLVNPKCDHLSGESKALACSSHDLLENAHIWPSFSDMRKHFDFLIATTCDVRDTKRVYLPASTLREKVSQMTSISKVALVFGRERNGLTTAEIEQCDVVSSLPLANPHPAINLSQAAMLYAFVFARLNDDQIEQKRDNLQLHAQEEIVFKQRVVSFLKKIGLAESDRGFREVLSRLPLMKPRDMRLVMFLLAKLK
jgi:tRNA/rRNA methyltransferase